MVETNRRRHIRVDGNLKVESQKISQEDYKKFKNNPKIIFIKAFDELSKTPEIQEVTLELLYKLIYQVNMKMDRILEILESKETGKRAFVESECTNISGSGMNLITNQRFAIGDIIAHRILLPIASQPHIYVLGKVTSIVKSDAEKKYNVSLTFVDLPEEDQDLIIRYVFNRQRELLKLSLDSSDSGK